MMQETKVSRIFRRPGTVDRKPLISPGFWWINQTSPAYSPKHNQDTADAPICLEEEEEEAKNVGKMIEMVTVIRVASIAKAMVKSSQDMGTLVFKLVNSRMRMRRVVKQQKHQQNMHQAQWDTLWFGTPDDAANAKQMQVRTTSSIRTMPIG